MPTYYEWTANKQKPKSGHAYPSFEVSSHPLKSNVVSVKQSPSKNFMENLNKWSSALDQTDPLLRFEQMDLEDPPDPVEVASPTTSYSKSWNTKKSNILHKYTTVDKLTIVSSFLPGGEKALIRQVSNLNEKVKHRLEQLDEFDESSVRKTVGLTQQEYIHKINVLNEEIHKAWKSEQRVKAFKIAIQCSKLLSDTNVMHFYPSKFVLITDILDNFGELVFSRLKDKGGFGGKTFKSDDEIDSHLVSEAAKETSLNWMYKMASIRELLPRLYMEMCLLKCYTFIDKGQITPTIDRLTLMIRGIGDPIVAMYLRMYLCRVASRLVADGADKYFYDNLIEFIEDYEQIYLPTLKTKHECQSLAREKYLSIYTPAVNWLMFGTLNLNKCKLTLLEDLLQKCQKIENNELLLYCVLSSFDSSSIVKNATLILEIMQKSADEMVLIHETLSCLGEHLCGSEGVAPPEPLAQAGWRLATGIAEPARFLQVLEPWIEFACRHLSSQHVNIILRGTIRYMVKCGKPADDYSGHFQLIFKRMLKSIPDVEELLLMDAFMPLVELVQSTNARTLLAKTVVSQFFERRGRAQLDDPVVIAALMRLCCVLHDSINAVTVEDEVKVRAELAARLVSAARLPAADQQLAFYVDCRAAFIKMDATLVVLVHAVNALSVRAPESWLQRACAAYCFVTVPSLRCALARAPLYLLCGQVALLNNCIGQAEANFKALVGLIPDIPEFIVEDGQKKPTHARVAGLVSDFLSTLLVLPDNVETNFKAYILSGFIKMMERIHWRKTDPLYYNTLLNILDLLCNLAQEEYSYHIDSVLSNDVLYGSEPEYLEAIDKYASSVCQELLCVLKALAAAGEESRQYELCLALFWRVAARGDLERPAMISLAVNLWTLAEKLRDHGKYAKTLVLSLTNNTRPGSKRLLQKLKETANAT